MCCLTVSKHLQGYFDSVSSVRYIFALNMFELGCINSTEWAVYQDWHSFLVEHFGHQVELEGIIYLRAPPQVPSVFAVHDFSLWLLLILILFTET